MMKKIFLMLVMAIVLFTTSCTQEEKFGAVDGSEVEVVFSAQLPHEIATRAYSDGSQATTLTYAVYEAGSQTALITSVDGEDFTPTLKLVKGRSYDILFWADATEAPYTFNAATQSITVNYDAAKCNDNSRDAFFAAVKNLTVDGTPQTVELTRPFAQLNLGTTDLAYAGTLGFTATQSKVVVKSHKTFYLYTGDVDVEEPITFDWADIPSGEKWPATDVTADYLAMNYLLVTKDVVDVTLVVKTQDSKELTSAYTNVPVQRNYRTNIYGSLLTDTENFTVTISPDYYTEAPKPKKVSIMGDSYSTFNGYIPSGYATYYPRVGVTTVEQTWWYQLCDGENYELEVNDSWSGSTISKMGYGGYDSNSNQPFITDYRLANLGNPDIILLFGGTNDAWNSLTTAGELVYSDWTEEQLKSFCPAFSYLLSQLKSRYPNAEIYSILNTELYAGGVKVQNPCVHNFMPEICAHYDVPVIYLHDIAKSDNHPDPDGMTAICDQVRAALEGNGYVPPTDPVTWYYTPAEASNMTHTSLTNKGTVGFAYTNTTSYAGKSVNALGIATAVEGSLTIGYTDGTQYEEITKLNLSGVSKTVKTYYIPTVTIPVGANLVFGASTDTGKFYYTNASSVANMGAFFTSIDETNAVGKQSSTAGDNLSINIGYDASQDLGTWTPNTGEVTPDPVNPIPDTDTWYTGNIAETNTKNSTSKPAYGSFAYQDEVNDKLIGRTVNAVRLAVAEAGEVPYGISTNNTYTQIGTITLANPSKDLQVYELPIPVTLKAGERLWMQGNNVSEGKWYYQSSGATTGKFITKITSSTPQGNVNNAAESLGIDFGYIQQD